MTQVAQETEAVGSAGRVPLPCGLSPKHQGQVEEEEGGHQQEAYNACVGDEGEGKGPCCDLTCGEKEYKPELGLTRDVAHSGT